MTYINTNDSATEAKPLPSGAALLKAIGKLVAKREASEKAIADIDQQLPALSAARSLEVAAATARKAIDETGLPPDTEVSFEYGRKDNRSVRTGKIVAFAVAVDTLPARYRVVVGSGIETELLTVPARDINLPGSN